MALDVRDDGIAGEEATFAPCSSYANRVGLYSEEIYNLDRQLG